MHTTLFPAAMLAVLLAGGGADAQARRDPAAAFDQADANKDGAISRSEYVAARSSRFDQLDRNKDGAVSTADFPRLASYPDAMAKLRVMIDEADTNHDGKVTRQELASAPTPAFAKADVDRDGQVSKAELAALRPKK